MPNINDAFPSNYIKAADLKGRQITVKMDRAEYENIGNDRKLVLYFVGKDKGMVLNKTNANNIATIYGEDTDDWHDQEIILFEASVDYQGKTVPAIRVKVPPRKPVRSNGDERSPQPPMRRPDMITSGPPQRTDEPNDEIPF